MIWCKPLHPASTAPPFDESRVPWLPTMLLITKRWGGGSMPSTHLGSSAFASSGSSNVRRLVYCIMHSVCICIYIYIYMYIYTQHMYVDMWWRDVNVLRVRDVLPLDLGLQLGHHELDEAVDDLHPGREVLLLLLSLLLVVVVVNVCY